MKKTIVIFILITLVSVFIRFNNYSEYVNFHLDPPLFFREVKDMVDTGKIRLIGATVTSKEIDGRFFHTGPTMYYVLAILGIMSNWNVVFMTAFFGVLWLITFVLIFLWIRKRFNDNIALIVYGLLSFFPWLVPYSRIIWDPVFIPLFGFFLFLLLETREGKRLNYLLAGLFLGLGISVNYSAALWFLVIFYYLWQDFKKHKFKIRNWVFLFIGFLIPNTPILLFEFRHDFYNLKTILFQIQYYKPNETYTFKQYYYYVFPFLPLLCGGYALVLEKLFKTLSKKIVYSSQVIVILIALGYSLFGPRGEALINPVGWTIERQQKVAEIIDKDAKGNFEVAALIGPETRAWELRWWLRTRNHNPLGVEDYEKTDILYLVAPLSRPPEEETVWEVKVLRPFRIENTWDLGSEMFLYKLVRITKVSSER